MLISESPTRTRLIINYPHAILMASFCYEFLNKDYRQSGFILIRRRA